MREAGEPVVRLIDADAWEGGALELVGRPVPVAEWLATLDAWGLRLHALPVSRIVDGPYDGGHVLLAQDRAERLYFAVPAAALPALAGHLPAAAYAALLRRTPTRHAAGSRDRTA